ncbi:MAG: hypothetical protein ACOX6P_01190 [Candidatus Merdivicinus sp.]|jgi:predicted HicB family RNase H-like nuclease
MFAVQKIFQGANVARTIRFTPELFEELNQVAAQNNISFNLLVLQCCAYALSDMEQPPAKENDSSHSAV